MKNKIPNVSCIVKLAMLIVVIIIIYNYAEIRECLELSCEQINAKIQF